MDGRYIVSPIISVLQSLAGRFRRSTFVHNTAKVAGGTAAAQLITLAASPVLTRLYTPEAFGYLGIFLAIALPLSVFATLRYDVAIVLPAEDRNAANLFVLSLGIAIVTSLLTALGGWAFRAEIGGLLGVPVFAAYFWTIPVMVLVAGAFAASRHWMIRKKHFGTMAIFTPAAAGTGSFFKIGAGLYSGSALFLIIGNIGIQAIQSAVWMWKSTRDGLPQLIRETRPAAIRNIAARYRDFPCFRMPQDLLSAIYQNAPGLLFAYYYTPAAVGLYLVAIRVLQVPGALISGSVRTVFYQRAAEVSEDRARLFREFRQKTLTLVVIGLPLFLAIALISPFAFGFVFGAEWRAAGGTASWLCIWIFAGFISTPALGVIPVVALQKHYLIFEGSLAVLAVLLLVIAGQHLEFQTTVAAFSVLNGLAYGALMAGIWIFLKRTPNADQNSALRA